MTGNLMDFVTFRLKFHCQIPSTVGGRPSLMNPLPRSLRRSRRAKPTQILTRSIAAIVSANLAVYAVSTWTGAGTDSFWSTNANWDVPPSPFSDSLVFDAATNLAPNNDFTGFTSNAITFGPNAAAYVLNGNEITLAGPTTNNSTATQTIGFGLNFSTARIFNAAAGNITLTGPINATTGSQLIKQGAGTLTISNPGTTALGNNTGAGVVLQAGTTRLAGGSGAVYNVTGELYVGDTSNQNVALNVDSGSVNISTWLAVARGNGNGTVSSDVTLNGSSQLTSLNFSAGYFANVVGNTPRGTITLNGTSTMQVTANNGNFLLGESAGSNIVLRVNDSATLRHTGGTASQSNIGVGGRGVLNIASPTATVAFNQVNLGSAANGSGAIYNRGVLTVAAAASTNNFAIGNAPGSYGYFLQDSASPVMINELGVGGAGNGTPSTGGGTGVLEVRSGTVAANQWITMTRNNAVTAQTAAIIVSGSGTLVAPNIAARFRGGQQGGADMYNHIDIGTGGTIAGGPNSDLNLLFAARATSTSVLAVHGGGVFQTGRIYADQATGTTSVNLDGGKIVATSSNAAFLGTNIDATYIYPGGAIFDTAGFNPTIVGPLSAPTGNGISSIPIVGNGAGYIGRPVVQIAGAGIGAAAVANFDETTGLLTGITVTSPGAGYVNPTITLVGGGSTTQATLGTAVLSGNVNTGGLTKTGAGILTLTAASTYGGGTTINGGTLRVTNTGGSGTGTGPVSVLSGGALGGTGFITGAVTVSTGGSLAPGAGVGTVNLGTLTLQPGSLLNYEITSASSLDSTVVTTADGLTINGGAFNLYVPGGTTTYSANGVYNLIGYTGNIGGTGTTALSVGNAVPGKSYIFDTNGGFVRLTVATSGSTPNFWNIDADGAWETGSNWTLGSAPNAVGASANFGGGGATITAPRTVNVGTQQTVGSLAFNSVQPYTLGGAALRLDNGVVPNSEITVTNGQHLIANPLVGVTANTQFTVVNASDSLTLLNSISGGTAIAKLGAGTLSLKGTNTFTGSTTLNAGTLEITGDDSIGASLTQNAGSVLRVIGAAQGLTKPVTFDLAGAPVIALTGVANSPANYVLDVPIGSNLSIFSTIDRSAGGSAAKIGGGSITFANPGTNVLSNNAGLSYVIRDGSITFDGGSSSSYSVAAGEFTIGDQTQTAPTVTLQSGTLNVGTFASIGRGNSTTGASAALIINGGTLNTQFLYSGFAAGTAGYNATPRIDINGVSAVNVSNTLRIGESVGALGTLNIRDFTNVAITSIAQIGFGGRGIVNISGSPTISVAVWDTGYGTNGANNTGAGVVRQTGGTIVQNGAFAGDWRIGGALANAGTITTNDTFAYGSHTISGASTLLDTGGRHLQIGAGGRGVLDISGGATVSSGGFPVVGRFPGSFGLLNISGGSFNQTTAGNLFIVGEQGTGVVNISGTGLLNALGGAGTSPTGGSGGIRLGHTATGSGILNIDGGAVQTTGITRSDVSSFGYVYLNGGTLRAGADNFAFLQGLNAVTVGPTGAVIDTNGFNINVAQNLNAPTGNGLLTIPVISGGTGYIGQPIVQIQGGGAAASATAQIDANGVLTGITITNPGTDYTAPTVNLLGGGFTTAATLGTPVLGANITTGGLIKRGNGVLTLSGLNTYTGPTVIEAGLLTLTGSISGSTSINVKAGAILDVFNTSGGFTVSPNQTIRGAGTVSGAANIAGTVAPGDTVGALSFDTALTFSSGSTLSLDITGAATFDQFIAPSVTLTSPVNLALNLAYTPAFGTTFRIIDNLGSSSIAENLFWSGPEGQLTEGEHFLVGGKELVISYQGGTGNDVTLTAVPEPGSAALLLATAPLLGLRRRRRA